MTYPNTFIEDNSLEKIGHLDAREVNDRHKFMGKFAPELQRSYEISGDHIAIGKDAE